MGKPRSAAGQAPPRTSDAAGVDYVCLLRAVNVGGKNRLPMAELRAALSSRGLECVSTVLQSGNVLCRSSDPEGVVAERIGTAIAEEFGLSVGVVVRSTEELVAVTNSNPFFAAGREVDPTTLHVAFLAEPAAASAIATLDVDRSPPDAFVVAGREVYLSYPNGSGRSRLTLAYIERCLGVEGTARNWRTVQRLAAGH
jgi:uncharacterized protein (DUF1697 family)